ncbi:MAG: hypothetical protein AAF203_03470, partial [Pseudomonadota bacterium]
MVDREFSEKYQVRKIRSLLELNLVDTFYFLSIYTVFIFYSFGQLPLWALFLGVHVYIVRAFNLRHEKAHLPIGAKPSFWFRYSDIITMPYLPYGEPFLEKAKKHISHHR